MSVVSVNVDVTVWWENSGEKGEPKARKLAPIAGIMISQIASLGPIVPSDSMRETINRVILNCQNK